MQPTRPATVTIATALTIFLILNLAVGLVAESFPDAFDDWGSPDVAVQVARIARVAERGGADLVILGDSTAGVGLLPSLIGNRLDGQVSVFNAALNGSNPAVWNLWARDVVIAGLAPSLVVIGVEAQNFTDTGPNTELYGRYVDAPARRERIAQESGTRRLLEAIPLIRYRSVLSRPSVLVGRILQRGEGCQTTDECLGWMPKRAFEAFRVPDWWVERYTSNDISFTDGEQQVAQLLDLVDYLKRNGIQVVLLQVPEVEDFRRLNLPDPERNFSTYQDQVRRVAEATGVALIDANQLTVGVDDYADPHHLNRRGAEKLSVWVAEQLQQHPDLVVGR